MIRVTVLPEGRVLETDGKENLLELLRREGFLIEAPCGGEGKCGKCRVSVDGKETLACHRIADRDMTVVLPTKATDRILTEGLLPSDKGAYRNHKSIAFDIGTTTVAGYLLEENTGKVLLTTSAPNPQRVYGADVVSRIRCACNGVLEKLTWVIRDTLTELTLEMCSQAGIDPEAIGTVAVVGNPAMQQLFMGINPENLARPPFAPVLTRSAKKTAGEYLPLLKNAEFLVIPDISAFVGADTVACVLATELDRCERLTLLVDIGTNGEMVLGNKEKMVACSTAAGPALEGANITFGMSARPGAIDRVFPDGSVRVIGDGKAEGICGSGLIDAVAVALEQVKLNSRGKILKGERISLTEDVYLTQEDIRQVQLAKGAISAGINLLCAHIGVKTADIGQVFLAGAFGSFMDPASACRIGLLPPELESKIVAVGNSAGSGAVMLAREESQLARVEEIIRNTYHLDLAAHKDFPKSFAKGMRFEEQSPETAEYWAKKARKMGFSTAYPIDISTLTPRADVREMCAADKCGAYGKNWTCPPYCGTLEECTKKLQSYKQGILVKTVGKLEKTIDTKGYRRAEEEHLKNLHILYGELRKQYPNALCLGSGGCRICKKCAYPEPCRFPEDACSSMEGYGLFVSQVCRDNGAAYYHSEKTVTYTACILF